jgi:hypothetical protein
MRPIAAAERHPRRAGRDARADSGNPEGRPRLRHDPGRRQADAVQAWRRAGADGVRLFRPLPDRRAGSRSQPERSSGGRRSASTTTRTRTTSRTARKRQRANRSGFIATSSRLRSFTAKAARSSASASASARRWNRKYVDRPRECENTALKMAEKRAHVGAVLNAFGLSEQFTQDVEDNQSGPRRTTASRRTKAR